jgi:hypothetical protein
MTRDQFVNYRTIVAIAAAMRVIFWVLFIALVARSTEAQDARERLTPGTPPPIHVIA